MEIENPCPCCFPEIEPCSHACTCRNSVMSGGCRRCARYGSALQKSQKAKWLAKVIDQAASGGVSGGDPGYYWPEKNKKKAKKKR